MHPFASLLLVLAFNIFALFIITQLFGERKVPSIISWTIVIIGFLLYIYLSL